MTVRRAGASRVQARLPLIAAATIAVFILYQGAILGILVAGLGGWPNYVRLYPVGENAGRIVRHTPALIDTATLLAREPLFEYGRQHPGFRAALWSYELTWSGVLFFASFSGLVGIYFGIGGRAGRWGATGSLGGAGIVALLGASVSSLAHCGLGSFGVLLAVAGISATTLQWFGRVEPVLIPTGYALIALAVVSRLRERPGPAAATTA